MIARAPQCSVRSAGNAIRHNVDWQNFLQSSGVWPHVDRCCIDHHSGSAGYYIALPTKVRDDPKRDTPSTDSEIDEEETRYHTGQHQCTVDVTSEITYAKELYD